MLQFKYKARDKTSGRIIEGVIEADTEMSAGKLLIKQDLYPLSIVSKGSTDKLGIGKLTGKISMRERVTFTRQVATLIKAGLPLAQALHSVQDQVNSKKMKDVVFRLTKSVEGGTAFAEALAEYPQYFNTIYISLIAAGESSGTLEKALERLANQLEKEDATIRKIRGALIYPGIVLIVIILVMTFMIISVVPQIVETYKSFNKPLPAATQFIVSTQELFTKFWFIVIPVLLAAMYAGYAYFKTPSGQRVKDKLKIKTPPFNQLVIKLYMARFARTLGALTASGIPILEALRLVGDSINNQFLKTEVENISKEVKSGHSMAEALNKTEYFLPLVGQMVKVGEDSGTLGDMLDRLAQYYEDEVDQAVKNISTIIEPMMIVFMGIMVIGMIVGILFPIYSLVGADLTSGGSSSSAPTISK